MQNILRVNHCQCAGRTANRATKHASWLFRVVEKFRAGAVGLVRRNANRAEKHFDSPQVCTRAFMGLGA